MQVYVRRAFNGYYYLIPGPLKPYDNIPVDGEFLTRRQAMRHAKVKGYEVVIKNRSKAPEIKEIEKMRDVLDITISNREDYEAGRNVGVVLKLPVDADTLAEKLWQIGAEGGEHGVDYFITAVNSSLPPIANMPIENLRRLGIDELNYIAGELEQIKPDEVDKLNAELQAINQSKEFRKIAEFRSNNDDIGFIPDILDFKQLGEYILGNGIDEIPRHLRGVTDMETLGKYFASLNNGAFTDEGYVYMTSSPRRTLERIPDEYKIEQTAMQVSEKWKMPERPRIYYDDEMIAGNNAVNTVVDSQRRHPGRTPNENAHRRAAEREERKAAVGENYKPDAYDKHKAVLVQLEAGIKEVFESEKYKNLLDTYSKFHRYSFSNCVLISMQKPDATYVAGFNFWKDTMKRHVKPGEKGIKILAPVEYKAMREVEKPGPNRTTIISNELMTVAGFKVVHVFDESQTYGEPMPKLTTALTASVNKYDALWAAIVKASPVPIKIEHIPSGKNGFYDPVGKCIVINEGMSQSQNIKTAIHEIAHADLHDIDIKIQDDTKRPDSHTREVQAESIAYAVCQHYELDTSEYSFGYIAGWSTGKELPELKASLSIISKEVRLIIRNVDENLREVSLEMTQEHREKEDMIQDILTEIKKHDPQFPVKGLQMIEDNMRAKSYEDLREIDYAFYFPQKPAEVQQQSQDIKAAQPETPASDSPAKPKEPPVFKSMKEQLAWERIQAVKQRTAEQKQAYEQSRSTEEKPVKTTTTKKTPAAQKPAAETQKKPSIRSQLAEAKKESAAQKPAPKKTKSKNKDAEL